MIVLSVSQLITGFELLPYTMLFLGLMMLVIGFTELQKDRKGLAGYMCLAVSLFVFYAGIQGFLT